MIPPIGYWIMKGILKLFALLITPFILLAVLLMSIACVLMWFFGRHSFKDTFKNINLIDGEIIPKDEQWQEVIKSYYRWIWYDWS